MNILLKQLIQQLKEESNFVGIHLDRKSGKETLYENYSLTVQAFTTWIDEIQNEYPHFQISHLFSNYYIIGFGKKIATQEELRKRLPKVEPLVNIISSDDPIGEKESISKSIFQKLFGWIKTKR